MVPNTFCFMSSFSVSEHERPYLILGADNMVVKLRLLELVHRDAEPVLIKPKSILVTGEGKHCHEVSLVNNYSF